ncbi:MAG: hypothetical protein ABEJ92_02900 [Halobacteriales archaeon]
MDWLRPITVVSLLAVAVIAGGAGVRLAVAVGDPAIAASAAVVALFLLVSVVRGARGRRWRRNPYW